MKTAISYEPTLMSSLNTKITLEKWYEAKDAYEKKDYKQSVLLLFDYVNKDIRKKYGNSDETFFKIPHGSVIIEISFTPTHFKVVAPFLNVGPEKHIPLYRKIAEVNFYPLNLAQINLEDQKLNFSYSCELKLCEPYKIYYLLQEICHNADNFDDQFIELFDVQPINEPKILPYSTDIIEKAWSAYSRILNEAKQYMAYFDQNRMNAFNWDILNISFKRIEHLIMPNGKLRTDIEREVKQLQSQDNIYDRIQRGKVFLDELAKKSKEDYLKDIYQAESFISIKARLTPEALQQNWKRPLENATKELQDNQHIGATLTLLVAYYDMFYNNDVPDDIYHKVEKLLSNASGKEWRISSRILYDGMKAILENKPVKTSNKSGGLFKKLFG